MNDMRKTIWPQIVAALPVISLVVAGCSLVLAGSSLGLSWYMQYRQSPRAAAAEYSRFYLTNADLAKSYDRIGELVSANPTSRFTSEEDARRVRGLIDFLDHVSYLADHSLIDNAFVANRIKCDIRYINREFLPALEKPKLSALKASYKKASKNMLEYYNKGMSGCSEDQ